MAEILASQILGHPLPLPKNLLNALNPNRFLVKDLIRRTN
jgi:tRNA 5-methylaminomethyl-2-thiouridine biosynthesis bifunctional protein